MFIVYILCLIFILWYGLFLTCGGESDVVVGKLGVGGIGHLHTDAIHLSKLLLEVADTEV